MPEHRSARVRKILQLHGHAAALQAKYEAMLARVASARYQASTLDLLNAKHLAYLSRYDLEAGLSMLQRHALLVEIPGEGRGGRTFAVPAEVGDSILRQRRAKRRGVFDLFTLRGHLDRRYEDPARSSRTPPKLPARSGF